MYSGPHTARQSVKADRRFVPFPVTATLQVIQDFPLIHYRRRLPKGKRLHVLRGGGLRGGGESLTAFALAHQ
ncbi:hypothetical protein D3C80_1855260 [compost metagenome]